MKTLITSILTFMCCVGMGQTGDKYIDSVMRNAPQLPNWALPVRNDYSYNFIDSIYPKRDTSKSKIFIGSVEDNNLYPDGTYTVSNYNGRFKFSHRDTVEILALVTDTTHEYTEPFNVDSATMISDSANILWWYNGKQVYPIYLGRKTEMPTYSTIIYAVRDRKYIFDCGNCEPFWDILYYLDFNMLSLKKSIIIWQVKYLK